MSTWKDFYQSTQYWKDFYQVHSTERISIKYTVLKGFLSKYTVLKGFLSKYTVLKVKFITGQLSILFGAVRVCVYALLTPEMLQAGVVNGLNYLLFRHMGNLVDKKIKLFSKVDCVWNWSVPSITKRKDKNRPSSLSQWLLHGLINLVTSGETELTANSQDGVAWLCLIRWHCWVNPFHSRKDSPSLEFGKAIELFLLKGAWLRARCAYVDIVPIIPTCPNCVAWSMSTQNLTL